MYLRVKEIFALAADYQPSAPDCVKFFQIMQNKLHVAATGQTAAELIAARVDHTKPNMGLTTWKGSSVRKADITVAKNYLDEEEISELNRIVVMWLDYAEDQAKRRKQVFLRDWEARLNAFLEFNDRRLLHNAGKVSKESADSRADAEYEKFAARRRCGAWRKRHGSFPPTPKESVASAESRSPVVWSSSVGLSLMAVSERVRQTR
jgi:hypothetical protein